MTPSEAPATSMRVRDSVDESEVCVLAVMAADGGGASLDEGPSRRRNRRGAFICAVGGCAWLEIRRSTRDEGDGAL